MRLSKQTLHDNAEVDNWKAPAIREDPMSDDTTYEDLTDLLTEQGLSNSDIDKVVKHVKELDEETFADSVMDSIAAGRFSLSAIVEDALKKE